MIKKNYEGWQKLLAGYPWFTGQGSFPLPAYSEFMPSPKLGRAPYGDIDYLLFSEDDPFGWKISELEEEYEVRPGLENTGTQIIEHIVNLGKGLPEHHIKGHEGRNLKDNPYWPQELAEKAGSLNHERFVTFLPLMLSRTQDDKGKVTWTIFGGSIDGPEKPFWKNFYTNPNEEIPEIESIKFIKDLLIKAYGLKAEKDSSLKQLGFRILTTLNKENLPKWTNPFLVSDGQSFKDIKYLLTFVPFKQLPNEVKDLYFSGKLNLLPFPGSLVFWGMQNYLKLQKQLPLAMQIPLTFIIPRQRGRGGLRATQSGWFDEYNVNKKITTMSKELMNSTFRKTHRWERIERFKDELKQDLNVDTLTKVLFSTDLDAMGLYGKPMARNSQIWTDEFELLLDGPNASHDEIEKARNTILDGGLFGYNFFYPPMRVGLYEVYWQKPLIGYLSADTGNIEIQPDSLTGYMSAYHDEDKEYSNPIELWPRFQRREVYISALNDFESLHDHHAHQTAYNILSLLDAWHMLDKKPLPRTYAQRLLHTAKDKTIDQWLEELPKLAVNHTIGTKMKAELEKILEPKLPISLPPALTYHETANRNFEEAWWNDIFFMAHGKFQNTDNADFINDEITKSKVKHHQRDLEELGDYLIDRHTLAIKEAAMENKALVGELPFKWQTDFDYYGYGGWKLNSEGRTYERNILVIIPGKNRNEAIVMGDHYDTAYMEDIYEKDRGGSGARISANGADDNFSATATLLQAAPIFLKMSKEGKLERDVWLIHLTGEEFPSDCLGARNFCQTLVEKTIKLHLNDKTTIDLSGTKVVGVYVLDMVAHNRDDGQDVFQISTGKSEQSLLLAYQAHIANMIWNSHTRDWNKTPERKGCKKGKRSEDGKTIPVTADFLPLEGDVRNYYDPHNSIFNTDGQIFSDVGAPVVLFMENYDISRSGYHDTKDTMENIDLDYGAAVAAIAIETVARTASLKDLNY